MASVWATSVSCSRWGTFVQIVTVDISISTGFMVSVIHSGLTGLSSARASCCVQFLGFIDKATTLQSVPGVDL